MQLPPNFFLMVVLFWWSNACVATDGHDLFRQAFPTVFCLKNRDQAIELNPRCVSRVRALMTRNAIPVDVTELRNLSDVHLMRLGMLAAISHISPWMRDKNDTGCILLDNDGRLSPEHEVSTMESNVMLCIVCALLAVIGAMHIVNMRPA